MSVVAKKNKKEELEILSPKSDFIFKLIFGDERRKDILADFLLAILDLPKEELEHIEITDPHVKKENADGKYGILDVKLYTKSRDIIDIEIQLLEVAFLKDRVVFYNSKMINEQLAKGDDHELQRVINILITDFDLIPETQNYHSTFTLRDKESGAQFTDITEINLIELSKLPEESDQSKLWDWMKFLKVKTKEELEMISKKNEMIEKAGTVLKELSQDAETRSLDESREKARLDHVWGLKRSYRRGEKNGLEEGEKIGVEKAMTKVAKELLMMNVPVESISSITTLPIEKVKTLTT